MWCGIFFFVTLAFVQILMVVPFKKILQLNQWNYDVNIYTRIIFGERITTEMPLTKALPTPSLPECS